VHYYWDGVSVYEMHWSSTLFLKNIQQNKAAYQYFQMVGKGSYIFSHVWKKTID